MVMEEAEAAAPAAFGRFPAEVRPGATRVGWVGIGVMGGAMAARLLAAGYSVTAYARAPAKAAPLVAAGARLAGSPASAAAASDVVFTMVGNPGDVRAVVLDAATGALAGLRPGGVLVDCTSSSPALAREVATAARAAGCHAVDAPVSGGDVGARDGTLAVLAGGDEAVVAWLAPLFAHLGKLNHMGPPGSGQSSKIANQITVAGAVVGLGESLAFAGAAGLDTRLFLGAVAKGAAGSRVMDIFGERALSRDFASGGSVRYIIKDLGMALEVGDGQEEEVGANVLPGAALFRQMFSAMAANGDGDLCLQGLITASTGFASKAGQVFATMPRWDMECSACFYLFLFDLSSTFPSVYLKPM